MKAQPRFSGRQRNRAFTLVELLVTMAIIALLISILLPALQRARDVAATLKCASNLRSIGQGLVAYAAENNQFLPASWSFRGTAIDPSTNIQTPSSAVYGYVHWSSFVLGNVGPDVFECPRLYKGGFPACDPTPGNFDIGQTNDPANTGAGTPPGLSGYGISAVTTVDGNGSQQTYFPDSQAIRCSYTLNESLCGRNFYTPNFQGAVRQSRLVTLGQIDNAVGTILATEFVDEWGIVSEVQRATPPVLCKSYRPVQGWVADQSNGGTLNGGGSTTNPADLPFVPLTNSLRRSTAADLWQVGSSNGNGGAATPSYDIVADYQAGVYTSATEASRLDFVGRNHGYGEKPADRKTNFLYADTHVETKNILLTVPASSSPIDLQNGPWEWGAMSYSIAPNNRSLNN